MKFYVYVSKLNNSSLVLTELITRINYKYKVENLLVTSCYAPYKSNRLLLFNCFKIRSEIFLPSPVPALLAICLLFYLFRDFVYLSFPCLVPIDIIIQV